MDKPELPDRAASVAATPAPKGFAVEFGEFWQGLPHRWVFLGLLAAWVALFHVFGNTTLGYVDTPSLFAWLENAWRHGEEDQMGYLMPVVVLVLLWLKREELARVPKAMAMTALGLLAAGWFVHFVGFAVQQTRLSFLGFLAGMMGVIGVCWGWSMVRATLFPLFLLVFCLPLGTSADLVTFPLRMLVSVATVGLCQTVLGLDVVRVGSMIFDSARTFQYDVAPACSGIRSLVALTALTTIFAFLTYRRVWKRLLVMVLVVPLAVVGNILRITCVVIAGKAFGQKAGATIEQPLGFVTFGLALAVLFLVSRWLPEDRSAPANGGAP